MTLDEKVGRLLAEAGKSAEAGITTTMEGRLSSAQEYAQRTGQDITATVAEIVGIGYRAAVSLDLAEARKLAGAGEATIMEVWLSFAQRDAQRTGQNITATVAKIEGMGYRVAVEVELAEARKYAAKGDASGMEDLLRIATGYAAKTGQDITAQVAKIRAMVKTAQGSR